MKDLVAESLKEYVNPPRINEDLSPDTALAIQSIIGSLGVLLTGAGIAALQQKLKTSKNKTAQKVGEVLAGIGKGAADGAKKSPSLGESFGMNGRVPLNEVDPGLIQLATYFAGALGVVATAGGIHVLIEKLKNSENKKMRQFAAILQKAGSGADEGTSKAPKSI